MNAFYPGVMKRGLFLVDWHQSFIMYSHKESDIDEALNICEDAMKDARKKA
jgi:glutamate-1-semialdehyde aminotransferase